MKEVPFIVQLLEFMGITVPKPITIKVDNMGAVYMSRNSASSARTRHMDTRHKFVNDLQEQGLIKVEFVPTAENTADTLTKNVTTELFAIHNQQLVEEKELL